MNYYHACYNDAEWAQSQENPAAQFNRDSTDALNGYSCWGGWGTYQYLNNITVQKALHVDQQLIDAKKDIENCK